jgi:hypothetical protein
LFVNSPVALGRTAIIPLLHEVKAFTNEEKESLSEAKCCASRYLPKLLHITDKQSEEMRKRAFTLRSKILVFLKSESVFEMADRIAENYGILVTAAEMVCYNLSKNYSNKG